VLSRYHLQTQIRTVIKLRFEMGTSRTKLKTLSRSAACSVYLHLLFYYQEERGYSTLERLYPTTRHDHSDNSNLKMGIHYHHVAWAHVMLRVQLGYLTLNSGAYSRFCHSAYVTWSDLELWSTHMPARLLNFCWRRLFVRRDIRRGHTILTSRELTWCYECSWDI
jgi:hypothetical protein